MRMRGMWTGQDQLNVRDEREFQILLIADLLSPLNGFAPELLLNRKMHQGGSSRSAMPMLEAGRDPHHIAFANFLLSGAPLLNPARAAEIFQLLWLDAQSTVLPLNEPHRQRHRQST